MSTRAKRAPGGNAVLTQREVDVLRLVAEGLTYKEAAKQLFISHSTVAFHMVNAYEKMGVRNQIQAVNKGRELGYIGGQS